MHAWPLLFLAFAFAAKSASASTSTKAPTGVPGMTKPKPTGVNGNGEKKGNGNASATTTSLTGARWRWPMPRLVDGRKPVMSQRFGPRSKTDKSKGIHFGVDVTYPANNLTDPKYPGHYTPDRTPLFFSPAGVPVTPVLPGVVTLTAPVESSKIRGQVYVLHPDGTMTRYAHLARVDVAKGDLVDVTTVVGLMGAGAGTPFRHLHFELFDKRVKLGGKQIDPGAKLLAATVA